MCSSEYDEFAQVLDDVQHPCGAAVELGHVAVWCKHDAMLVSASPDLAARYNESLIALIDRLGERIFHVHTHDLREPTFAIIAWLGGDSSTFTKPSLTSNRLAMTGCSSW